MRPGVEQYSRTTLATRFTTAVRPVTLEGEPSHASAMGSGLLDCHSVLVSACSFRPRR